MILHLLVVGELATNCYVLGCPRTHRGLVIDPGGDAPVIIEEIRKLQLNIEKIVLTHGHIDHWAAAGNVVEATGASVAIHTDDAFMLSNPAASLATYLKAGASLRPDVFLREGDTVTAGTLALRVLHTPGHTPGGICLYTPGTVFTGDTLFEGSIGRHDLPGGDLRRLIASIKEKLLVLPDETKVYPGHGSQTTIAGERRYNPYLTEAWD
ncbi:MAG: Beta-lactamase domain-containing protein [Clostridia bacterium 62_21]|nr:MAG: Beta-lactamase domain-containing protein [Clostridia bacterium 62_21]HAG07864.1 MBL fold metallo-hydrolase [Peptococcaceae bacterium]